MDLMNLKVVINHREKMLINMSIKKILIIILNQKTNLTIITCNAKVIIINMIWI